MKKNAYTLIEMLIALVIIFILSGFVLTSYNFLPSNTQNEILKQEVITFLQRTRALTQSRHEAISFCIANAKNICSQQGNFMLLFNHERILARKKIQHQGVFHWRLFSKQTYFTFSQTLLGNSNGTLWFCFVLSQDPVWAIAINKLGQIHILPRNNLGHINDTHGKALQCK